MYALLKDGKYVVNRANYEYMCDSVEDLEKIPKDRINLGTSALVITEGELKVFMANGKDEWVEV